jgi:uncharacterized protein
MHISGYLASILIGILLGLIGGGGSILTVPILVYLFKVDAILAITYSLFIVGITSAAGTVSYFKKGLINFKIALIFGIPSIAAILFTRAYIVPSIPKEIAFTGSFELTRGVLLLLLFAILMILVSFNMVKKSGGAAAASAEKKNAAASIIFLQGTVVGILTGLIGAGGGFLIIPALVNFLKLSMKAAVGTSLFIIAINSLAGFFFSVRQQDIHWPLLLTISFIAIAGVLIGVFLSSKIDGKKLRPAFGWLVLVMGIYIIIKETVLK